MIKRLQFWVQKTGSGSHSHII